MLNKLKIFVKNLFANKQFRSTYQSIMKTSSGFFSSNKLLSIFYHWIFFIPFYREQYAVLRGKYSYYKNNALSNKTNYCLRRNTHRLEKGMLFKTVKDVFALDYIEETIEAFEYSCEEFKNSPTSCDNLELLWARDVLEQYFTLVTSPKVEDFRKRYFEARKVFNTKAEAKQKIPYPANARAKNTIDYEQFLDLSLRRRSVRWFLDKQVPREEIDKAIIAARQAPSACNRQPFEFRIYDDPELVKRVSNIPFGTGGYADNIPTIMVIVGRLDSYFSTRDRHLIYIDSCLAAMSFMYAAETLGFSTCPINWPDFEPLEAKMQKALKLKPYQRPIMLVAIGYADPEQKVAFSEKKDLDSFRYYNKLGK